MGREIKRVPVDFDWPLKQVWAGYENPFWEMCQDCPDCGGSGYSDRARELNDIWYGKRPFQPEDNGSVPFDPNNPRIIEIIEQKVKSDPVFYSAFFGGVTINQAIRMEARRMCAFWNGAWQHHLSEDDVAALVEGNRLWDFTRRQLSPEQETHPNGWTKEWNGYTPTPEEVNWWSISSFGHDSSNCHAVVTARCRREGVPNTCPTCNGDGQQWPSRAARELYENWRETEPPPGDGWQLWETVSEGSPISPVFADAEGLVNWLIHEEGYSEGAAEAFVQGSGWAPSLVAGNGRVYRDIESHNMPQEGDR